MIKDIRQAKNRYTLSMFSNIKIRKKKLNLISPFHKCIIVVKFVLKLIRETKETHLILEKELGKWQKEN